MKVLPPAHAPTARPDGVGVAARALRLENSASALVQQKLRAQAEAQQPVFDALRDELRGRGSGRAAATAARRADVEVERWRERVTQLLERRQAALAQTDVRQRELEQLGRQLRWPPGERRPAGRLAVRIARRRQEQIQAVPLADSQAVVRAAAAGEGGSGQGGRRGGAGCAS